MNIYKIKVGLTHTWTSREEYECEVKAENIDEANNLAKIDANHNYDGNIDMADHDDHYINSIKLIDVVSIDGDQPDVVPRCNFTKDMFSNK